MNELLNQVFNEDCLIGLSRVADGSVDLVLTDPPYNVSMRSGFASMGRTGVDFGEWDKGFDQETYLEVLCRKVRKGGSVVVFNDYKNIGTMKSVLENNGFTIKELLIWKKSNPMPRNRDRLYVTTVEVAIWAVKGKGWTFNRSRGNYENAIFEYPVESGKKRFHPTQKPAALIEELVKIHSNEGDIVLDAFMGSGTTAIACINTNRNYIGFELDETYHALLTERINTHITQNTEVDAIEPI